MMPLVVVRRSLAGRQDIPGRGAKDRVRQTRLRICDGITVESAPTGIMYGDDVAHEIERRGRRKLGIAKSARELTRQRGVVVHHDRTVRAAGGRRLNEHDWQRSQVCRLILQVASQRAYAAGFAPATAEG